MAASLASPRGSAEPSASSDAELLRLCLWVRAFEAGDGDGSDPNWASAVRQVSELRPATLAGLHAKARLALSMTPFGAGAAWPDWVSPDERLIWSVLRDALLLAESEMP